MPSQTDFLKLLLIYQGLPRSRRKTNFMEVAGYPHYENVCSNILGFYLDLNEEHGLGDLLLRAFVTLCQRTDLVASAETVKVHREFGVEDQKRIDLVIESDAFVLGIENKIYHQTNNDLDLYARSLQSKAGARPLLKMVLCLKRDQAVKVAQAGFIHCTYRELWEQVRNQMGHFMAQADSKWVIYLNDFMENTSRLTGESEEEKALLDFFVEHQDLIERLIQDRDKLLGRIGARIQFLNSAMEQRDDTKKYLTKRWVFNGNCLASQFKVAEVDVVLDMVGDFTGWTLTFFERKQINDVLARLFNHEAMTSLSPTGEKLGNRHILQRWDLRSSDKKLEEDLSIWTKALIGAADSLVET